MYRHEKFYAIVYYFNPDVSQWSFPFGHICHWMLTVLYLCPYNYNDDDDDIKHCGYDHATVSAKENYVLQELDSNW